MRWCAAAVALISSPRRLASESSRPRRRSLTRSAAGRTVRSASACWNSTSLLSKPRAIRYSTVMNRPALHLGFSIVPGPVADAVSSTAPTAARAADGLWKRDPSVWSGDSVVREKIVNRLGWLASPALILASVDRLRHVADDVRQSGFDDVVLLGMGGSSLAPEVLRAVVGVASGWPRFHMIDSTDPAAVRALDTAPARTLYILASKSGGTIEPNSLAAHFRRRLEHGGVSRWGAHFIAITDAGTELATLAASEQFRHVFINPSDIGGRYSALSFFGMVP